MGEHGAQVQAWVGEIQSGWKSKLDVVVHDSAESIGDVRLREAVAEGGANVEAFYDAQDGRIHLLADRVGSKADAERLLRHEGIHWAINGKLNKEYDLILEGVRKRIPETEWEKIIKDYPDASDRVRVEEYLAYRGQENRKSKAWEKFAYEVKQVLKEFFGKDFEVTDADVQAFLTKANRELESGSHRGERTGDVGELKFSRSARELLDGEKPVSHAMALQAMREQPNHVVTLTMKRWLDGGFRDIQNGKAPETEVALRKFLQRLPKYRSDQPLYRGVPFRNESEMRAFLRQFEGHEWVNTKPFMSATKNMQIALGHTNTAGYPVFIHIRKTQSGRDLEPFKEFASGFEAQREVVFSKNSRFRIVQKPSAIEFEGKRIYSIRLEEF